ncbi:MAG: hypothetical protein ACYDH3_12540 [Candidatus Aminicenantales bacterium]
MTRFRNLTIAGLILLAVLAAGCKRTETPGASPVGPSTYALTFTLTASPSILLAGEARPTSLIRSVVTENGSPAAGRTVYFTIISGLGEFGDLTTQTAVVTNSNGLAEIFYIGPTKYEIDADTTASIMGQLETSSPQIIAKSVDLTILLSQ